jgi:hypothetical protein
MSKHRQRSNNWPMPLLVVGVLGLGLPLLTCWQSSPVDAQQTAGSPDGKPGAPTATPLDRALQLVYEARKAYAEVRDYECTLVKQERVHGSLTPQDIILMKFRQRPFSVNMQWLSPRETAGQEVSFIYGQNGNQMRVRFPRGLKKALLNYVNVDPFDRRVMERSRHNIYEAGIGNLIEQTIKSMEMEKRLNKTNVSIEEYSYNERPCWRVESTRTERTQTPEGRDVYYSYRSVHYLDKERKLPLRTENYDWPYQGGSPGGELLEVFSFVDLHVNVGLTDAHFAR